jgi:hypothetical protein
LSANKDGTAFFLTQKYDSFQSLQWLATIMPDAVVLTRLLVITVAADSLMLWFPFGILKQNWHSYIQGQT